MLPRVLAAAAAGLLLMLAGFDSFVPGPLSAQATATPPTGPLADARHEQGRAIYNYRCYFCHGYSGNAKTLAASYLEPRPRDFSAATPQDLPVAVIVDAVRDGRAATAMKGFRGILDDDEIRAVADFVAREFVRDKAANTAYHTAANGWPGHERYAAAFPFARGDLALDTPVDELGPEQLAGRQLFLGACVSCHDRARVNDAGPAWSSRPVSYPRMGFVPGQPNLPPPDVVSTASVYAKHEVVPKLTGLTRQQRRGEALFRTNCAFCHGGDGTGKNWIGQFMEPKARDLTQYDEHSMPPRRLRQVILDGLPDTSMPAWRHVLAPAEVEAVGAYVRRAFFRAPS